jgi:hypothetical protein
MPVDHSSPTRLCCADYGGGPPTWAPDGSAIAFIARGLQKIRPDGTGLATVQASASFGGHPAWSPDGTQIAYTASSNTTIRVTGVDGTGDVAIVDDGSANLEPDWQTVPIKPYIRPKGASPFQTYLVPAYKPCESPNRTHGAPLSFDSCSPPVQASDFLTVGTPDSNGQKSQSIASVVFAARAGNPTPGNQADVAIRASFTDVRNKSDLSDYGGELQGSAMLRLTDRQNYPPPPGGSIGSVTDTTPIKVATSANHGLTTGAQVQISGVFGATCANGTWTITVIAPDQFSLDGSTGCGNGIGGTWQSTEATLPGEGTVEDVPFSFAVPCTTTSDTGIGSNCSVTTTANAINPDTVVESGRAIWQLDQVKAYDGGSDGLAATQVGNTLFMDQGIFVP